MNFLSRQWWNLILRDMMMYKMFIVNLNIEYGAMIIMGSDSSTK